ncbi:MAG: GntR family transcriptional regulator [Burkholderiales bacterium]
MPSRAKPDPVRLTLRDRAYEGLRDLLIAGQLAPGEKLSMRQLATALGVSPMPVREAVHRLVAERALEVQPQSAVRVPLMTREHFSELTTIRINLEGMATQVAAGQITAAELTQVRRYHERFRDSARRAKPNPSVVIRANQKLHFAIYRCARMPTLLLLIETLWLRIGPVLIFDLRTSPRRLHTLAAHECHEHLVAALEHRDGDAARRALARDIESASGYILSLDRLPRTAGVGGAAQDRGRARADARSRLHYAAAMSNSGRVVTGPKKQRKSSALRQVSIPRPNNEPMRIVRSRRP